MTSEVESNANKTNPVESKNNDDSESQDCANQCFFKKLYLSKMTFNSLPILTEELYSFWLFQPLVSQATISVILQPPIAS